MPWTICNGKCLDQELESITPDEPFLISFQTTGINSRPFPDRSCPFTSACSPYLDFSSAPV